MGWTRKDLLSMRELDAGEITLLVDTAASLQEIASRDIKKVPALRGKNLACWCSLPQPGERDNCHAALLLELANAALVEAKRKGR